MDWIDLASIVRLLSPMAGFRLVPTSGCRIRSGGKQKAPASIARSALDSWFGVPGC